MGLYLALGMVAFAARLPVGSASLPSGFSKTEVLAKLKELRESHLQRSQAAGEQLGQALLEIHNFDLRQKNAIELKRTLDQLEANVETRQHDVDEQRLRTEFYDRLIFETDGRYRGGDLSGFLKVTIKKMAFIESNQAHSDPRLRKFLTYLGLAVQQIPERDENLLEFIDNYLRFSSITNPVRPDQFRNSRDYTNSSQTVVAQSPAKASESVNSKNKRKAVKP